ncbi:protein FAR1-RELATED SEQUENCE 3-like [Amaranthus tricolor]|uniref:protein FAR1-RELATED SEQUENCE 3-like n=1 Tax=Amaranthus tricolor TaxID=29722 RepID=UPI00258E9683|nr:protein FAR1-RELATED SEQUENCE 3-like [Amaranthus tricolor]
MSREMLVVAGEQRDFLDSGGRCACVRTRGGGAMVSVRLHPSPSSSLRQLLLSVTFNLPDLHFNLPDLSALCRVQLEEIDELVVYNASSSTPKPIFDLCLALYGEPKTIIPHCEANLLPEINMMFDTLDDGLCFYKNYATACGFEVRRFGEKKQGQRTVKSNTTRKRLNSRVDYPTIIGFRRAKDEKYVVFKFVEGHNHGFASPTTSFHMKGSSDMHIGNKDDFKNFDRDLKGYINDGQMFVEMFLRKKENYPIFFFDIDVDDSKSLCLARWADGTCRRNYAVFGDSISMDATYSTNKYNLVFVPFTGVDNHKRCGEQPYSIIIDQDLAVKIALSTVFPKSVHKFCVWNIMKKLKDKDNEPHEFESEWSKLVFDYKNHKLDENVWLSTMYNIREMWVPAYLQMRFQSAIDAQSHKLKILESKDKFFTPPLKTPLMLEKHAASIYTLAAFYDFQAEICTACFECGLDKHHVDNGKDYSVIYLGNKRIFNVVLDPKPLEVDCSWDVWNEVYRCAGLAESSIDDLQDLLEKLKFYSSELLEKKNNLVEQTKDQDFEDFVGCKAPEVISIQNPKVSSNKGTRKESDTNEKDAHRSIIPKRCKTCGKIADHNSRTCPDKNKNYIIQLHFYEMIQVAKGLQDQVHINQHFVLLLKMLLQTTRSKSIRL